MGDDGDRIGRLVDAMFDQDSLNVDAYVLRSGGWKSLFGRGGRIQPGKVHSCSRELMMVATGRVKELVVSDVTPPVGLNVPLKVEDRLPAPSYESVPDGQTVAAPSR